jgi:hypothetical protein
MSVLAAIVTGHVNKVSHKNPHGLTLGDLGISAAIGPNGYIWLVIGGANFILQWGTCSVDAGEATPTTQAFSRAFTNCFGVVMGNYQQSGQHSSSASVISTSPTGFVWQIGSGTDNDGTQTPFFIAIGN